MSDNLHNFTETTYYTLVKTNHPDFLQQRIDQMAKDRKAPFSISYYPIDIKLWLEQKTNNETSKTGNIKGMIFEVAKVVYYLAKMIFIDIGCYVISRKLEKTLSFDAYMALSCLESSFGNLHAIFSKKGLFRLEKTQFDKEMHQHLLQKCQGPQPPSTTNFEEKKETSDSFESSTATNVKEPTTPEKPAQSAPFTTPDPVPPSASTQPPTPAKPFTTSEEEVKEAIHNLQFADSNEETEKELYAKALNFLTQFDDEKLLKETLKSALSLLKKNSAQKRQSPEFKHALSLAWLSYMLQLHSEVHQPPINPEENDLLSKAIKAIEHNFPNDTLLVEFFANPSLTFGPFSDVLNEAYHIYFELYRQALLCAGLKVNFKQTLLNLCKYPNVHVLAARHTKNLTILDGGPYYESQYLRDRYLNTLNNTCKDDANLAFVKNLLQNEQLTSSCLDADESEFLEEEELSSDVSLEEMSLKNAKKQLIKCLQDMVADTESSKIAQTPVLMTTPS